MSTRCRCGHHRLTHTYTADGNVGRCQGHQLVIGGIEGSIRPCDCTAYDPTEEDK